MLGGLLIRLVEPGIVTAEDGIWWSLVTATTVGYGDIAPKTSLGRLIAVLLMLTGIGTLGMITGSIATFFIGVRGARNPHIRHVQSQLDGWDEMSHTQRHEIGHVLMALARARQDREEAAQAEESPVAGPTT